jgi:tRNA uridine 5-carboxymethylaminomethyl modification enzyme
LYVNGLSTSLPVAVQLEILHSIPGLENADDAGRLRDQYDYYPPVAARRWVNQSKRSCRTDQRDHWLREAAGQGIVASLNAARRGAGAARRCSGARKLLYRCLVDDLVTRSRRAVSPSSRSEFRLRFGRTMLRRLAPIGGGRPLFRSGDSMIERRLPTKCCDSSPRRRACCQHRSPRYSPRRRCPRSRIPSDRV